MATKRAKPLDNEALERLLGYIELKSRMPVRDKLIIMLSFKAGLRSCEIAKMRIASLTDSQGNPARDITVFGATAKGGCERQVPMHPDIRAALLKFQQKYPNATHVAFSRQPSKRRTKATSVNALTVWFSRLYREANFRGASSHSGRRTFAIRASRLCCSTGATLYDVQKLLGHRSLATTEVYLEPSSNRVSLVNSL